MKRLCALAMVVALIKVAAAAPSVDLAFKRYWDAANVQDAATKTADIVASGVAFDDAYARLQRGRTYPETAARGVVRLIRHTAAGEFPYTVDVPETYDAGKKYQ